MLCRPIVKDWSNKVFEKRVKDYEVNEMNEENKKVEVLAGQSEGKVESNQSELDKFLDDYGDHSDRVNISEFECINYEAVSSPEWKTFSFDETDPVSGEIKNKSVKKIMCVIDGKDVVIPIPVMNQLKTLNKSGMGRVESFKVIKEGSGLATRYTVVPLKWKEVEKKDGV